MMKQTFSGEIDRFGAASNMAILKLFEGGSGTCIEPASDWAPAPHGHCAKSNPRTLFFQKLGCAVAAPAGRPNERGRIVRTDPFEIEARHRR
jgi:hypothetical protein